MTAEPSNAGHTSEGRVTQAELDVVRRHSGQVGWPTIVLTVVLIGIEAGVFALWFAGVLPTAVGFLINSVVAYAWYTVHHEATHKTISGRQQRWRWLDPTFGQLAGIAMQLPFSGYADNHLRHHAHVNGPKDPDLLVKGPLSQVPLKWLLLIVAVTLSALPWGDELVTALFGRIGIRFDDSEPRRSKASRHEQRRWSRVTFVILLASIPLGLFYPLLLLWWLPSRVGLLALMVLFQWLPHFPFDRMDRFGATRAVSFRASTWLLLQQDRHLVHHLYPSVPWYRYGAVLGELRPFLIERGARLQGRGTEPKAPIELRS